MQYLLSEEEYLELQQTSVEPDRMSKEAVSSLLDEVKTFFNQCEVRRNQDPYNGGAPFIEFTIRAHQIPRNLLNLLENIKKF